MDTSRRAQRPCTLTGWGENKWPSFFSCTEPPGSGIYKPCHWVRSSLGERQLFPHLTSAVGTLHWSDTSSSGNRLFLLFLAREGDAFKHLQATDVLELAWFSSSKSTENLVSLSAQTPEAMWPLWNPELKAVKIFLQSIEDSSKIRELNFASVLGESTKRHRGGQALSCKVSGPGAWVKVGTHAAPCRRPPLFWEILTKNYL